LYYFDHADIPLGGVIHDRDVQVQHVLGARPPSDGYAGGWKAPHVLRDA